MRRVFQSLAAVALLFASAAANAGFPCGLPDVMPKAGRIPSRINTSYVFWAGWWGPDAARPGEQCLYITMFGAREAVDKIDDYVDVFVAGGWNEETKNRAHADYDATPQTDLVGDELLFNRELQINEFNALAYAEEGIAYKRRVVINGPPTFIRYGTVPTNTPCTGAYGAMGLIDRAKVTKDSALSLTPDTAWARCK